MLGIPKKEEPETGPEKIIIEKYANGYTVRSHTGSSGVRAKQQVFRDKKQLQEWLDKEIE